MFFCKVYEFSLVFGLVYGKMEEISKNLGIIGGPTPRRRDPSSQPRASPWRSHCSQHGNCCVLVLFRYSVAPRTCLLD